ncbi:MAG: hypothetical protein RPU39_00295 [Candidatus Sedimenticola sp. (ex Thyasira tokunagai)]
MGLFESILGVIALLASLIGAVFAVRSKAHKAEAQHEKQRADSAEATSDTQQRVDQARTETEQRHREEQRDDQISIDAGDRSHLDNGW